MANGNGGGQPQEYQSPEITELGRVQDLSMEATGTVCTYDIGAGVSACCNDTSQKSISVTTQADCAWSASTTDSWITLVTASGTGSGNCTFTLSSYSGTVDRTGTITIQGVGRTVTQRACPAASFTPSGGACGQVTFTDTSTAGSTAITTWLWNFGDGTTSSLQSPTHQYASPATSPATVQLTVTDGNGCTGTTSQQVTFTLPPTASFSWSDAGCAVINFDAGGSSTPSGTIVSWDWNFGDGSTGSGQMVQHTYTYQPGVSTFQVQLTVTDSNGCTASKTLTVTVDWSPVARFEVEDNCGSTKFDGSGSCAPSGSIVSWAWDFGDGNTGSGSVVYHSYAAAGTYLVSLTVTDNLSNTNTTSRNVNAVGPIVPPEPFALRWKAHGLQVDFESDIPDLTWDFGDGTLPVLVPGLQASHTYAAVGIYNVVATKPKPPCSSERGEALVVLGPVDNAPDADLPVCPDPDVL